MHHVTMKKLPSATTPSYFRLNDSLDISEINRRQEPNIRKADYRWHETKWAAFIVFAFIASLLLGAAWAVISEAAKLGIL